MLNKNAIEYTLKTFNLIYFTEVGCYNISDNVNVDYFKIDFFVTKLQVIFLTGLLLYGERLYKGRVYLQSVDDKL